MKKITLTKVAAPLAALSFGLASFGMATAASAATPRPGCGYGDENHSHQAAPGQDPLDLRPGKGTGDSQHPHTAPPGQAPDGAGDQNNPRRGCN